MLIPWLQTVLWCRNDVYNVASTRRLQECWVGRYRDARVIKVLGLVVMSIWTTTCYALVGTGTRGCLRLFHC